MNRAFLFSIQLACWVFTTYLPLPAPEPTLEWLSQCANNAIYDLWDEERGNGKRTAKLLNRIWNSFEEQIWSNTATLQRYSDLVERLVNAGVALGFLWT